MGIPLAASATAPRRKRPLMETGVLEGTGTRGICHALEPAYAWGRGVAPLAPASLALLAGLGLAVAARDALQKLERKFYFTDWRHGDHSG